MQTCITRRRNFLIMSILILKETLRSNCMHTSIAKTYSVHSKVGRRKVTNVFESQADGGHGLFHGVRVSRILRAFAAQNADTTPNRAANRKATGRQDVHLLVTLAQFMIGQGSPKQDAFSFIFEGNRQQLVLNIVTSRAFLCKPIATIHGRPKRWKAIN